MYYLPAYVALERWLLHKRVVVVSPAGPEGPRRLAAAGAARVLVVGGRCPAEAGLEVLPGPVATESLPLRDASVDAVAYLEGFADLDADSRRSLIAEAGRVLRDGGILAVCTNSDAAALSRAEADLHDRFGHVVSFAELAWQGVSLAPVLADSPGDSLTPVLREGLLQAPLPPRRHLVLASAAPLEGPQRECVIIPTGSVERAGEIAAAISTREEIAAPGIAVTPIAPMPAIGAPPDLDDLFGDAPTLAPAIAPVRPISAPDPTLLAELAELRRTVADLAPLRERAAELEHLQAQVAEVEQLREQAAEVERLRAQLAEVADLRERAAETEQLREQVFAELERLHERSDDAEQLREQVAELERLREQAAEVEHLREQVVEAERLRERVDEHLRHRLAEAEQLRERAAGQLAEVEQLRERAAEAERLREQVAEVDRLREQAAEAERLRERLAELEQRRERTSERILDLSGGGDDQSAEIARLREQLAQHVAELEELREDAVEVVYLREQLAQLEPLRGRADELEQLRRRDASVAEERDKLLAHAARLARELERSREEKARTEAELHSARLRIESLQRVPEDSRLHSLAALGGHPDGPHAGPSLAAHELVDEVAPLVAPETGRATTDAALDRNRLREELARRTGELQTLETQVLQQEEELRRERLENVRLVTDVDRLREQVERSRAIELERVQELERLGHELRALEVNHAELQGMYNTQEQRLRDRGELLDDEDDGRELEFNSEGSGARARLHQVSAERDQLKARERASAELARRRDRELAEATRTVRELRRSVDEHASVAAELRGELAVLQVHVQRLEETLPMLQERLRDQQRKTLDREEEAAELQRRLEESVAEQEHLRGRLRKLRQDLDAIGSAKQGAEVELFRLRRELEAKHEAIEQLQQIVALGTGSFGHGEGELSDAARNELLRLRAAMAEQAADHAEALARSEAEHQRVVEGERGRLRRARLEAAIRAEEMEYLLYLLDTAEQKIWEMNDAEGRAAARLAAGLAQLDKQREQYEDLADELEVTRNLLVEAQAKVAELERALDNERARLARVSGPPDIQPDTPTGAFEINLHEPDHEAEDMLAPLIQRDPDESDRLAGINFDDDDDDGEESMAVRLAASPVPEPTEADLASVGSAEVSGPRFALPSDDVDIDDDDDHEPLPPRVVVVPDEDDDEDDEVFTIDTEWDDDDADPAAEAITVVSRPPTRPPAQKPSRPPLQKTGAGERELSNSRIVIELLEDEAWPEDSGEPGAEPKGGGDDDSNGGKDGGGRFGGPR